ncbi:MAG: hypothetical protein JWM11_6322 [Planctomycetaceae bacterium]|nr:hypothetical protein [Planctomycetaceae bacterium]
MIKHTKYRFSSKRRDSSANRLGIPRNHETEGETEKEERQRATGTIKGRLDLKRNRRSSLPTIARVSTAVAVAKGVQRELNTLNCRFASRGQAIRYVLRLQPVQVPLERRLPCIAGKCHD